MFTPKFLSNQYIESLADCDPDYKANLTTIKNILEQESKKNIGNNPFEEQKGVFLDEVVKAIAKRSKTKIEKSADMLAILNKNVVLLADIKLNSKTGSDIYENPFKVEGKYKSSMDRITSNPKFENFTFTKYPKFVLIMPDNDFNKNTAYPLNSKY